MATKNIDLNKLREEIDIRKKEKNNVSIGLGETPRHTIALPEGAAPRDVFLSGLLESLNSGIENESTTLVKKVDNIIAEKKGEKKLNINENTAQTPNVIGKGTIDMGVDRDELLFKNMEIQRKDTIAKSIGKYTSTTPTAIPQQGGMISEEVLNTAIQKTINDNFAHLVGEAIDSAVIEMFTLERIEKVLKENTDLIKSVVLQTIKDIQSKRKSK